MVYRQLGTSNLNISRIGLGCMSLKPGNPDNSTIILNALQSGINFFDTADLYDKGANELLLGNILKNYRKDVIISTKVGNQWRADGSGWDWNPRKEHILYSVEQSLKRLQTDYIDLYLLHGGTIDDPTDETIDAFEYLVSQGKIRYYGISSIRPNVIRYWATHSKIVCVMMQYSLLDRRPEEECLHFLDQKNIGVLSRGGVAQGLLVDKPPKAYLDYAASEVEAAAAAIEVVSGERTRAQAAILFVLNHPSITAAVIGVSKMLQLREAVQALDVPVLSNEELKKLSESLTPLTYKDHR